MYNLIMPIQLPALENSEVLGSERGNQACFTAELSDTVVPSLDKATRESVGAKYESYVGHLFEGVSAENALTHRILDSRYVDTVFRLADADEGRFLSYALEQAVQFNNGERTQNSVFGALMVAQYHAYYYASLKANEDMQAAQNGTHTEMSAGIDKAYENAIRAGAFVRSEAYEWARNTVDVRDKVTEIF
jgi:hypothetical protein